MKKIIGYAVLFLFCSVSIQSTEAATFKQKQSRDTESKQCTLRNNTCAQLEIKYEIIGKRAKRSEFTLAVHKEKVLKVKKQGAFQLQWKNADSTLLYTLTLNSIPSEVRIYESGMVYIDGKFMDTKRTKIVSGEVREQ